MRTIGKSTFAECSKLKKIDIPGSVTSIEANAFESCTNLTDVTIPGSVTSIGNSAFKGCAGLNTISIGRRVVEIGGYAFYLCDNLTDVDYDGTEDEWNKLSKKLGNVFRSDKVTVHFNSSGSTSTDDNKGDSNLPGNIKLGDVDGDGKVSAKDSMSIQRYVLHFKKLDSNQLRAADADSDGKVTNKDAMNILRYTIK